MKFFFSIVSHQDHAIIINLESMKNLALLDNVEVLCRDNIPADVLKRSCLKHGAHYLPNSQLKGFAENNNDNFIYAKEHLGMTEEDYFILINPDVLINQDNITRLLAQIQQQQPKLATVNLYLDKDEELFDDNVRLYPKVKDFIGSFLFNNRSTMVNRNALPNPDKLWVSGAFMVVKAETYHNVGMMDAGYYMYCEDIDFCNRLKKQKIYPEILSEVKAVHYRRRRSKLMCSLYFKWHVFSVARYTLRKRIA